MWIGFIWYMIRTGDRPLWTREWSAALSKVEKFLTAEWTLKNVLCHVIWEDRNAINEKIFVNNQLDAQFFFMYVYFYSLHVSGSHVTIIRSINCINKTSGIHVYVTMYRWSFGVQVWMRLQSSCSCSTTAGGNRDGLTGARCCNYSYICSWWCVELPPETCRASSLQKYNKLYIVAFRWTIIDSDSRCTEPWT
jgi:hypothetical protein